MKKIVTILIVIVVIIIIAGLVFVWKSQKSTPKESKPAFGVSPAQTISPTDKPQIVSTKPDPLDNSIVPSTETIEISFNRSLENVGEFKLRIEPSVEHKVELSGDRKTAKIIFAKPLSLGTSYTMFIGTETKFDGVGRWGEEKIFRFRTIKYTGV